MQIRPATEADVPAVAKMVDRLAQLHEKWDPQRYDYKPYGQMHSASGTVSNGRLAGMRRRI